ncbi:hypothetical protein CF15_07135 [Pyrodictium occultum]|uniref:ABC transporter permease n=1 Tax=Pyrodictium occultum TaxID=2309 RepID=A0A0V8RWU8_PYROC|nr:ABC transporter permease subunit [Pyrodictium occultum]KSW12488.1 hypothetical protein CF15_07135 [Pyrodictium occultum]
MRSLIAKELKTLIREPMVVMMIVMPVLVYALSAPFYSGAARQAEEAARLRGVRLALLSCHGGGLVLRLLAASLRSANVSVDVVDKCSPVEVLEEGYDVAVAVNATGGRLRLEIYVGGDLARLARTLALPGSLTSVLARAMSPGGNVSSRAYVLLNGRLWGFEELSSVYYTGVTMGYASLFILFPAASLGAALIGAEREERMLDVLLSLPVPRRSIALSKAVAALVVALLAAGSAFAGLFILFSSLGLRLSLPSYYTPASLGLYTLSLASESLLATALAMLVGLFASTVRGAQSAAALVAFPALIPFLATLAGLPSSSLFALAPYAASIYTGLSPILGLRPAALATLAQLAEAAAALLALARLLESETAVTGPETLRRLLSRLRARR